jgi:hypothetical protein
VSLTRPAAEELEKMGWKPPPKAITSTRITGITDPQTVAGAVWNCSIRLGTDIEQEITVLADPVFLSMSRFPESMSLRPSWKLQQHFSYFFWKKFSS